MHGEIFLDLSVRRCALRYCELGEKIFWCQGKRFHSSLPIPTHGEIFLDLSVRRCALRYVLRYILRIMSASNMTIYLAGDEMQPQDAAARGTCNQMQLHSEAPS